MFTLLSSIFKSNPAYTVEEIHAEIDSAQDRLIQSADRLLKELKIPTETEIERKAKLLKEIGFNNSETVVSGQMLENERKRQEEYIANKRKEASQLKSYQLLYPCQKFLTIEEFDRICDKYGLIYSEIKNYIKDVPEKNLLDIKNATPLGEGHFPEIQYFISCKVEEMEIQGLSLSEKNLIEKGIVLEEHQVKGGFYGSMYSTKTILTDYFKENIDVGQWKDGLRKIVEIHNRGYYIAAPASHFDLSNTTKIGERGFFTGRRIFEPLDPIVFQYCKGKMVRILTKWGTADDQSYLDPKLTNEKMN